MFMGLGSKVCGNKGGAGVSLRERKGNNKINSS
jgi:hypothetical protein